MQQPSAPLQIRYSSVADAKLKKPASPRSLVRILSLLAAGSLVLYFIWWGSGYRLGSFDTQVQRPSVPPIHEEKLRNEGTSLSTGRHPHALGAKTTTVFADSPATVTVTVQQPLAPTIVSSLTQTASQTTAAKAKETEAAKDPRTLVFRRRELQKIWLWEVASGHYPTSRRSEFQRWFLPQ